MNENPSRLGEIVSESLSLMASGGINSLSREEGLIKMRNFTCAGDRLRMKSLSAQDHRRDNPPARKGTIHHCLSPGSKCQPGILRECVSPSACRPAA